MSGKNWVDRGEPELPKLTTVIHHFFGVEREISEDRVTQAARDIQGLVWSDATELHVSGYLRRLGAELGIDENELPPRRMAATALWSIAKLAMVRDTAMRALEKLPYNQPRRTEPLSDWLAARLLSAEELAAWQQARNTDKNDDD